MFILTILYLASIFVVAFFILFINNLIDRLFDKAPYKKDKIRSTEKKINGNSL